jgi:type III secretory pathway lipoprotein EscJ
MCYGRRCWRRSRRSRHKTPFLGAERVPFWRRVIPPLIIGFVALQIAGCDEQILHDLSEQDANRVLSRLGNESLGAKKVLQSDGRWAIAVERKSVVTALSYLDTNRVLSPRSTSGHPSNKGGFVPSREEQWFRYERSVALSLEDSLNTLAGVLEARVHLNLPETDPLFGTRKELTGSGSVLLVVDNRYTSNDQEIAALVAGAAGIPVQKVTVLRSRPPTAHVEPVSQPIIESAVVPVGQQEPTPAQASPEESVPQATHFVMDSQVSMASAAFAALLGTGAVLFIRRRRRVRFVLPSSAHEEE